MSGRSSAWGLGCVAPWIAELWTPALAKPFFKSNGVDVRPIIQSEALLKFAIGGVVDTCRGDIERGVGPRQYGAGRSGGAELEVHEIRAAARMRPEEPIGTLDVANAFGSVEWDDALEAVLARSPRLAPAMAVQWQAGRLRLWLLDADGQGYHSLWIYGSLLQGGHEGHPAYCLVMAAVLAAATADRRVQQHDSCRFWLYVDDVVLQAELSIFGSVVMALSDALAAWSLVAKPSKSAVHVPSLAATPTEHWPPEFASLSEILPLSVEGLTILGTDASGDRGLQLGPLAAAGEATRKRSERAVQLADAAVKLAEAAPPAGGRQAAWMLSRCIIRHALDYDARVLPGAIVAPHADIVESAAQKVEAIVTGDDFGEGCQLQARLPVRCGGLQLHSPSWALPLARAACLLEIGPAVRSAISRSKPDECPAEMFDGVTEESDDLVAAAASKGVHIGPGGKPVCAAQAASDPLRSPCPMRHLLSSYLRTANAATKAALLQEAEVAGDLRTMTRLHSASGPTAGASLIASPTVEGVRFGDEEFRAALRWRLGLGPPSGLCRDTPV